MSNGKQNTRWYNLLTIVDIETGEVITKSEYEKRNYRVINKTYRNEFKNEIGIRHTTWECRPHEQQRLFD